VNQPDLELLTYRYTNHVTDALRTRNRHPAKAGRIIEYGLLRTEIKYRLQNRSLLELRRIL